MGSTNAIFLHMGTPVTAISKDDHTDSLKIPGLRRNLQLWSEIVARKLNEGTRITPSIVNEEESVCHMNISDCLHAADNLDVEITLYML